MVRRISSTAGKGSSGSKKNGSSFVPHTGRQSVENIVLEGEFYPKETEFSAPNKHNITGIIDLDGDGKMEVVIYGAYYEGAWVSTFQILTGAKPKKVLETGCGV
ncbi:MAG: hypothetical protein R2681_02950 [Pyrinomonadaceae bacterium]